MPLIWAAISAHGFGHAAQVVPVLNALGRLVPDLRVLLRTTVPASFFKDRLVIPWKVSAVRQDVGCIQNGPLTIDVEATWCEHERFHATWADRVQAEVQAMRDAGPDMVLADTPYLAVAAGAEAAIPTVALASFTWDLILSEYPAPRHIDDQALMHSIRRAYAQADLALRITPAPKMDNFRRTIDIGPIAEPAPPARDQLTKFLALAPGERTVLVGFGGIPLTTVPFADLEKLTGYRFLFDGPIPPDSTRFVSTQSLPFSFKTLLASVDAIMTKPGYGTLVEAVALKTPVVYVRRYNFADEPPLVDYLHRHGRGIELSLDDFTHGRWEPAVWQALATPEASFPPPPTGAAEAADVIARYCQA
jgi:UDP:flavonoid glycosyltransferase YjiC (YdhE family)